jgi:hypothetical protein
MEFAADWLFEREVGVDMHEHWTIQKNIILGMFALICAAIIITDVT